MEARMLAAVVAGGGLVTAGALGELGIDPRLVTHWLRAGRLVVLWRGVYTTAELWESWDIYRARPLARIRAVELALRVPHVLSHDSAAIPHELPLLRPQDSDVHLTRRHLRASITSSGVHHHGAAYADARVVEVHGLRTLDIPRTVADIARLHGYRAGLVAADGAMQRGTSRVELFAALDEMEGWPYSLTARCVIEDADPGAESVGETLSRELVCEAGLGPVETQFPVQTPVGVAWTDLRIGRHLVEFDGAVKFRARVDGGVADKRPEEVVWDERKRQHWVCAEGFGMSRLSYDEFWGDARERAKARLLAEAAVTADRFGRQLTPQQAATAARLRGLRYKTAG